MSASWNPWHGCRRVSEGCRNCYVYRIDDAHGKSGGEISLNSDFLLPLREGRDGYRIAPGETVFTGIGRLRIKESDRVAAMAEVLGRFGVEVLAEEARFVVRGTSGALKGGSFRSFGDHRIAMATAIGATRASAAVEIDDARCAAKSYPRFFDEFAALLKKCSVGRDPA